MSGKQVVSLIGLKNFSPDKGMGSSPGRSTNGPAPILASYLPLFKVKEASDLLKTSPRTFAGHIHGLEKIEKRKRGQIIWRPHFPFSSADADASGFMTRLSARSHISFMVSGPPGDPQESQCLYNIDAIWKVGLILRGPLGDFLRMQLYEATKALLSRDEVYDIYRESQGLKGRGHGFVMYYKKDYHYLFLICPRYKTPQEIPDSALDARFRKGVDASGILRKNSKFYPLAIDHFRTRLLVYAPIYNGFRQLCYLKVRKHLSSDHFLRLLQEAPERFEEPGSVN